MSRGGLLGAAAALMTFGAQHSYSSETSLVRQVDDEAFRHALKTAFSGEVLEVSESKVVFGDGSALPRSRNLGDRGISASIENASIEDMFAVRYPFGAALDAPEPGVDPGRSRSQEFMLQIYGDCRQGEVARDLIEVEWLPNTLGSSVRFTARAGAASALRRVSIELDQLPGDYDRFLHPTGGTYACRTIAGTDRLSMHAMGAAIDLAVDAAHYWRWDRAEERRWRNSFPAEIVHVFERHGFVWGGRWDSYDTMHFEYRPELLAYERFLQRRR